MNCIKWDKELINSAVCACDKIKLEEKLMGKKYRVLKELRFNNGFWQVNGIFEECDLQPFDVKSLLNQFYIEEVKEDTLESILENYRRPDTWNIENDILKTKLSKWHNKDVVEQKIELLKEVLEFIPISYSDFINNKISELEKEIEGIC